MSSNQPRKPGGTPVGGQFDRGAGAGGSADLGSWGSADQSAVAASEEDFAADDMVEAMGLLDDSRNMGGALSPEVRARVWTLIESPSADTWWGERDPDSGMRVGGAHSIVVGPGTFGTLWQAVNRHTDYDVDAMSTGGEPVPTRAQIVDALREVTKTAADEHDKNVARTESLRVKNDPALGPDVMPVNDRSRGHTFFPPETVRSQTPPLYATDGPEYLDVKILAAAPDPGLPAASPRSSRS